MDHFSPFYKAFVLYNFLELRCLNNFIYYFGPFDTKSVGIYACNITLYPAVLFLEAK